MVDRILNKEGGAPEGLMIFTGNANPKLASDVARHLGTRLGRATVAQFSDGESTVEILEHVRGKHAVVLQSLVRLPMTI